MTRVLVVEDEKRVASFIADGLKAAGYVTDIVSSGADATERVLGDKNVDLVLLDVGLPDKDGFEVLVFAGTLVELVYHLLYLLFHGAHPGQ